MKLARQILNVLVLLLTGAGLLYIIQKGSGLTAHPNDAINSADFISIILTALGVILAALALFLGGLAIIGWTSFEAKLAQSAEEFLERRFSTNDQRYVNLIDELKQDVRREMALSRRKAGDIENNSPFDESAA